MPTTRHPAYTLPDYPTTTVTAELLAAAHDRAQVRADTGMRPAQHEHGRLVGFIGELVALDYLTAMAVPYVNVDTLHHDVQLDHGLLEIKTRRRGMPMRPHFEFEVPAYSHDFQTVDWYLFVNVQFAGDRHQPVYTHAHIAGTCTRDQLHDLGTFRSEPDGDILPRAFMPGWRIEARHLTPVELMVSEWRHRV